MTDNATYNLLDSRLFGTSVDHYNQETGCYALSLAEQIGRTVAMYEGAVTKPGRAALQSVLCTLEILLEAERDRLAPSQRPLPARATAPAQSGRCRPMRPVYEALPASDKVAAAYPRFDHNERVQIGPEGANEADKTAYGNAKKVLFTKEGWMVRVLTKAGREVDVPPSALRRV